MKDHSEPFPTVRTWRTIPQPVRPRAMSREGRKRFIRAAVRTTGLATLAVVGGWGALALAGAWRSEPKAIARAVGTAPLGRVDLRTDGLLTRAWVERTLDLPRSVTLMELDLPALQQRLLASGQVRSVVLTKNFPSTLGVTIVERTPVAQLRAENGRDFFVARDGVVFEGIGYDEAARKALTLPWLAGLKLERTDGGFAPVADMDVVADLLALAQNRLPELYRTWTVVDLSRLADSGEIGVRSTDIGRVVFSATGDFLTQLARLDYVHDAGPLPLDTVNLSLGSQVVVDRGPAAAAAAPKPSPAARRPGLPAFPSLSLRSKPNRDL